MPSSLPSSMMADQSMAAIPHQELELKAVVSDPAGMAGRLAGAGAVAIFSGTMRDRWYDRDGELTARDVVLRTRLLRGDDGTRESVLGWKGPTRLSADGYKLRDELEYKIEGGVLPDPLLLALGYTVVHARDRTIQMYRMGNATIRVEHYPLMDILVEVEGSPEAIERAITATGIDRGEFTPESLSQFVLRYEGRTGEKALVSFPT